MAHGLGPPHNAEINVDLFFVHLGISGCAAEAVFHCQT